MDMFVLGKAPAFFPRARYIRMLSDYMVFAVSGQYTTFLSIRIFIASFKVFLGMEQTYTSEAATRFRFSELQAGRGFPNPPMERGGPLRNLEIPESLLEDEDWCAHTSGVRMGYVIITPMVVLA